MRNPRNIFHLAIPCKDLNSAQRFYVDQLGCRLARSYDDRITLDFFGDQVVCHLAPDRIDLDPQMYPRHFGVTFRLWEEFEDIHRRAEAAKLDFFRPLSVRFLGLKEEHQTFFLRDPSNNLIEFKFYCDPSMMY